MGEKEKTLSAETGAWVSISAYLLLATTKLIFGEYLNSRALFADGLNNTTDIIASVAVLIGLKVSKKPADANHPYGHSRAETIASLIASFVMVTIGIEVIIAAIKALFAKEQITPDVYAGVVALISAGIMFMVYLFNRSLAKKTHSHALMAAAKDNLSDSFVSIGAFIGIIGAQFNLPWLDPLAAIVVGFVIIKTAWDIFFEAAHMLSDGFIPEKLETYKETIIAVKGVKNIKDIKARTYGNKVIIDATIEVDPDLSVIDSHNITERVEDKLREEYNILDVHIHIEPIK